MLKEAVDGLNIKPGGIYVDATFGGGGHAKEILKKIENGQLMAFDRDIDAIKNKVDDERLILLNNNFRYLKHFLKYYKAIPVDGILADLGVSSHQFDTAERGFSTRFNSKLDMRMDIRNANTAVEIVNDYSEEKLSEIFNNYGELNNHKALAKKIIRYRSSKKILTVDELKMAIYELIDKSNEDKFMARVFQALRIETNQELEALKEMLTQSLDVLKPGGRLAVISYHSLEDRMVKNFMKSGRFDGEVEKDMFGNYFTPFTLITKKPLTPDDIEINQNKRARSAKLRIAEKN
jgi:16S rRNA (cytosine1402-N4)-methyltransferase